MHLLDLAHWALAATLKERGTLSAAASALGITQSAATQRLQEAERRLGVSLARKDGRTLILTDAGEIIAVAALATLPELQQAENDAIWQGKRNANQLKLAINHFDPPALALRLIGICQNALDGTTAEITRVAADKLITAMSEGTVDLALYPGPSSHPGLGCRPVATDRLVAVFPMSTTVVADTKVQPDAFAGTPFLTYDLRPAPGWEYDRFFNRGQSFPGKAVKIESTELICRMVAEGAGSSILPNLCVRLSDYSDRLAVAELDSEPILFDWHLLHGPGVPDDLIGNIADAFQEWLMPTMTFSPAS